MHHRALVLVVITAASCAAPRPPPAVGPRSPAPNAPEPAPVASSDAAKKRHGAIAIPSRPPPPRVTTPMNGEPPLAALASEARLQPTTCDAIGKEQIDARVKAMRAEVDRAFQDWHEGQPECWRQDREAYAARKEAERASAADAAGYGGIGLGSIGTIGHGAGAGGSGAGVGFGSGYGRLSGAHASGGPTIRGGTPTINGSAPAKAASASGTNNQVASVDEADIVKTDGRYVYLASNGALRIVEALKPRVVSVSKVDGTVRELFVEGDRAVVYSAGGRRPHRCTYGYDCAFGGDGTSTKITVFDVSDRAAPKVVRTLSATGSLVAARRIGETVHSVLADGDAARPSYASWPDGLPMCGNDEAKVRARFAKLKVENEEKIRKNPLALPSYTDGGSAQPMCTSLMRTAIRDGEAFTSVLSFDLRNDKAPPTTATMQSRPGAVFASETGLYVSVIHRRAQSQNHRWYSFHSNVDEVSEIHKFAIGASASATRYVGSGTVPGHVLNQFAMDEWNGYLRIATTKGKVPDPRVSSSLSILAQSDGGALVRVGAIDGIAPGEDIRAVRFDDDRGYVVTFKKTDPLFVMDLYEPARPKLLGELKIPGFSTYIHRIDPERLLSIGFDANDHGDFAFFDGIILQLFDVKSATEPKLLHKEEIGTRGSSSEAATNHLAFNYFAEKGLLAIPMTICDGGGDGKNGNVVSFSGLLVYDVDRDDGFKRIGGIDHGAEARAKNVSCNTWWSNATSEVKRSVFLDDLVYSIADDRVKVARLPLTGEDVADLSMTP